MDKGIPCLIVFVIKAYIRCSLALWYQLFRCRHGDPMPYGIGYKGIDNVIPCLIVLVLAKVSLLGHGITLLLSGLITRSVKVE